MRKILVVLWDIVCARRFWDWFDLLEQRAPALRLLVTVALFGAPFLLTFLGMNPIFVAPILLLLAALKHLRRQDAPVMCLTHIIKRRL